MIEKPTPWPTASDIAAREIAIRDKRIADLEAELRLILEVTPWSEREPGVVEIHQMMVPGATAKRWRRLLKMDEK